MSKPKATRAHAKSPKPVATGRARRAPVRARSWPRRWLGWSAGGAVLIAVVAAIAIGSASRGGSNGAAKVAAIAPDGVFSTTTGATETVRSLRGQPTLLWFVATWCSSCQAGTQAVASQIGTLAAHHVRVVELEFADDLGQPGPSIADFGRQLAGPAYHDPDWTFGVASSGLTSTYDPSGYLDIYYLLDASGRIVYANSSPAATMSQLLAQVSTISPRT